MREDRLLSRHEIVRRGDGRWSLSLQYAAPRGGPAPNGDGGSIAQEESGGEHMLFETMSGLLAGVETAPAKKAGNDAGLDRNDVAARTAGENEMVRQTVQGMKGGWGAIGPAGGVNHAGFPIHETGNETAMLIALADATGTREHTVIDRQRI